MSITISTIRPGLLVSLSTSVAGPNVAYSRRDVEPDHLTEEGARRARWETERVIEDPREHEAAIKVRSRCRTLITRQCSPSSFGLLCPETNERALAEAITEARELAASFNEGAALTRVGVYVIAGRVSQDDVEAVRAINSEIRGLMSAMENGLQNLDVKGVREAADRARSMAAMLSPEAAERAQKAIDVARKAAREITKAGETVAMEIDEATLAVIRSARGAFLDLGRRCRNAGAGRGGGARSTWRRLSLLSLLSRPMKQRRCLPMPTSPPRCRRCSNWTCEEKRPCRVTPA